MGKDGISFDYFSIIVVFYLYLYFYVLFKKILFYIKYNKKNKYKNCSSELAIGLLYCEVK